MTAVWIVLGFLGGRAVRYLLNRAKTPDGRVVPSRLPLRAPLAMRKGGAR